MKNSYKTTDILYTGSQYFKKTLAICLFALLSTQAMATDYYVSPSGNGSSGTSWATAYTDLQSALDVAVAGDKIYVASGTYKPSAKYSVTSGNPSSSSDSRLSTFKIPNGVEVYGGLAGNENPITQAVLDARNFAANTSVLSGDFDDNDNVSGSWPSYTYNNYSENADHVVFTYQTSASTVLDGFTIRGGNADGNNGGGWYNNGTSSSSVTARNLIFTENQAGGGAAMYNINANSVLTNCSFSKNTSTTDRGGAVYNEGGATQTLTNCSFTNNVSNNAVGGGAIFNEQGDAVLTGCAFTENHSAGWGGAVYNDRSNVSFTNCTFKDNTASRDGGAIHNLGNNTQASAQIIGCAFLSNSARDGGAVSNEASGTNGVTSASIVNCTFASNSATSEGGALYNRASNGGTSAPTVRNSIFWNNTGTGSSVFNSNASLDIAFSLVQESSAGSLSSGTTAGDRVIYNASPGFISSSDLNLQSSSPAINAGSAAFLPSGLTTDAAGNTRTISCVPDLGAYENQSSVSFDPLALAVSEPTNGATNVALDIEMLYVVFNGDITPNTGNVTVVNETAGSNQVFDINGSDVMIRLDTMYITVNGITDGAQYHVLMDAGVVSDVCGVAFGGVSATDIWSFKAVDNTAPAPSAFTPADNATNVSSTLTTLEAIFDEPVMAGSGNINLVNTSESTTEAYDVTSGSVSFSGNTVTVTLTAGLVAEANYHVTIDNGAILDAVGNAFAGITSPNAWNFTVESANGISLDPEDRLFDLYPNPTSGHLRVSLKSVEGTLTLINTLGKVVVTEEVRDGMSLDLSHLPKGVYIAKSIVNGHAQELKVIIK